MNHNLHIKLQWLICLARRPKLVGNRPIGFELVFSVPRVGGLQRRAILPKTFLKMKYDRSICSYSRLKKMLRNSKLIFLRIYSTVLRLTSDAVFWVNVFPPCPGWVQTARTIVTKDARIKHG